jgi:hypothetical protein
MAPSCQRYREQIQELVDGTLGPIRRAELELHMDQCADCRAFAGDMRAIQDTAAALDRPLPPDRVWLQIAGRLRQEGRVAAPAPVRAAKRHGALIAIAAALLLAVGSSLYLLVLRGPGANAPQNASDVAGGNPSASDIVQTVESEFRLAEQHYQNAISKLEQVAKMEDDDGAIDAQTAAMLKKNLQVIDQAIAESRAALQSEPQSAPARDSLFDALKRKMSLLQDTIALMNEMRKGDSRGAAQVVEGINKS